MIQTTPKVKKRNQLFKRNNQPKRLLKRLIKIIIKIKRRLREMLTPVTRMRIWMRRRTIRDQAMRTMKTLKSRRRISLKLNKQLRRRRL